MATKKMIVWLCLCIAVYSDSAMASQSEKARFTYDEAAPLLRTLSKLHRVTVVDDGPYLHVDWPHICWLDKPELHVSDTLAQYPGTGLWLLLSDFPRICLAVQPDLWKEESEKVNPEEFLAKMVSEIPKLAEYLEQQLGLEDKPELGVEVSRETLELPHIEDRDGPGGGVVLAADPKTFAMTSAATSV